MPLNKISTKLRTIHNGSKSTVKAQIVVSIGAELTVPDDIADALLRSDGAFKEGPATADVKALAADLADEAEANAEAAVAAQEPSDAAEATEQPKKPAAAKKAPAKKAAAKKAS